MHLGTSDTQGISLKVLILLRCEAMGFDTPPTLSSISYKDIVMGESFGSLSR